MIPTPLGQTIAVNKNEICQPDLCVVDSNCSHSEQRRTLDLQREGWLEPAVEGYEERISEAIAPSHCRHDHPTHKFATRV